MTQHERNWDQDMEEVLKPRRKTIKRLRRAIRNEEVPPTKELIKCLWFLMCFQRWGAPGSNDPLDVVQRELDEVLWVAMQLFDLEQGRKRVRKTAARLQGAA